MKQQQYDLTIRKLIDVICKMNPDDRGLLLAEAERLKSKLRSTRRNCCIPVLLHYANFSHPATITNLSFTGAFVECMVPVIVGDAVAVEFKKDDGVEGLKLNARIMHATSLGIGIRFNNIRSRAAQFLQKCLDDNK